MSETVLRVYDPTECDERGVPLDWERCRACAGTGCARAREFGRIDTGDGPVYLTPPDAAAALADPCGTCGGHGSLKAAVLAGLEERLRRDWRERRFREREARGETFDGDALPGDKVAALDQIQSHAVAMNRHRSEDDAAFVIRCEGCWHPMGEGTWDGVPERYPASQLAVILDGALTDLCDGFEPASTTTAVYFSPCDEECQHDGPVRAWTDLDKRWRQIADPATVADFRGWGAVEAAWRQVDVRTLGWPHDLRPEKLAVLCLRCWADRQKAPAVS